MARTMGKASRDPELAEVKRGPAGQPEEPQLLVTLMLFSASLYQGIQGAPGTRQDTCGNQPLQDAFVSPLLQNKSFKAPEKAPQTLLPATLRQNTQADGQGEVFVAKTLLGGDYLPRRRTCIQAQLCSPCQLPANTHPGRQEGLLKYLGPCYSCGKPRCSP